jgi:hypothetical protein
MIGSSSSDTATKKVPSQDEAGRLSSRRFLSIPKRLNQFCLSSIPTALPILPVRLLLVALEQRIEPGVDRMYLTLSLPVLEPE